MGCMAVVCDAEAVM